MAEPKMLTTWDGFKIHAEKADKDSNGESLTLGFDDRNEKVVSIGGKAIAGSGGDVPTVNNAKLKLQLGEGEAVDTGFTANASSDATVTIPQMTGATSSNNGVIGLVPAPAVADKDKFLKGDGTWADIPSIAAPDTDDSLLLGQSDGSKDWVALERNVFGTALIDETGLPILDEDRAAVYDTNSTDQLWSSFADHEFGARRAYEDQDGNNIVETYARKDETSVLTEASVDDIDAMFQTTVTIGGRQYKTVIIGNQEWLAENLDYKFTGLEVGETASDSSPRANYYNNDEATYGVNGNRYGLLYNWIAAEYLETHKADLLPSGWHIPTASEWTALFNECGGTSVAGTKLKSTSGWSSSGDGDGSTEFNAVPSGYQSNNNFSLVGDKGHYVSNEVSGSVVYYRIFQTDATIGTSNASKANGLAIRLVRNIA